MDGQEHDQTSLTEFLAWKTRATTLESVSASFGGDRDVSADRFGPAMRIATRAVTPDWFDTLGVRAFRGRVFTSADYQTPNGSEVMLISYWLWQSRYGRDAHVLDTIVRVNGVGTRIVGVLPPDFAYQSSLVQAWFPLRIDPTRPPGTARMFNVVALRRPGSTLAETADDVERVSQTIADEIPKPLDWRPHVVSLIESERGWARQPLDALELAAALVLLVACANIGGLLLARNAARRHEFAMRSALGATRGRLVRQVLAESALLTGCAGAAAFVAAWPALGILTAIMTPPLDAGRLFVNVDVPLAAILAGLMLVVTIAVGIAPAVTCTARPSIGARRPGFSIRGITPRFRFRGVQLAVQIGASVVLLVSAALVVQSFWAVSRRDLGFDRRGLLLFQIRVPGPAPRPELQRIQDALADVPGVDAVGGVSDWWLTTLILPKTSVRVDSVTPLDVQPKRLIITPGFFAAIRAPLVSGREFSSADDESGLWSVVVNQESARRLWPGRNPIGEIVTLGDPDERPRAVIGVVGDMPLHREDLVATPMVFTSSLQQPPYREPAIGVGPAARMTFALRHRANGNDVARDAQERIGTLGVRLPFVRIGEADELGQRLIEFERYAVALSTLAFVAMGLALIGLYGVTAHAVTERTREVGIRLALGASPRDILRAVGREALTMSAVGLAAGWAGTLVLPRLIASRLWGVGPSESAMTVVLITIVAATAATAAWVPLRRALRVDPAITLRAE